MYMLLFLNQACTSHRLACVWFLEIALCANFCMAAVVSIVSRHSLSIDARRTNQLDKSKLLMYNHFNSHCKQLYISNKKELNKE